MDPCSRFNMIHGCSLSQRSDFQNTRKQMFATMRHDMVMHVAEHLIYVCLLVFNMSITVCLLETRWESIHYVCVYTRHMPASCISSHCILHESQVVFHHIGYCMKSLCILWLSLYFHEFIIVFKMITYLF